MQSLLSVVRGGRLVLLSVAAVMGLAQEGGAQLIVNGSFEQPLVPIGSYTDFLGDGSHAIPGWTVVGVDAAVVSGSFTQSGIVFGAQDGNQFADLTGSASNSQASGVTQNVPILMGQTYQLRFQVGSAQGGGIFFPATIDLSINGGPRRSFRNPAMPSNALDWREYSVAFTALGASATTLTFYNGGASNNYNSAIDNVSLTAIPIDMIGKIAFARIQDANNEIYVMNADGSNQTRLTLNSANDTYPNWSPNGTRIVFYSDRDGNDEIYVMNADGTNPTRLTDNSAIDVHPAWSPDGTRIALQSDRGIGGVANIYVMNADGTNVNQLTNGAIEATDPAWSPDGTRIAFSHGLTAGFNAGADIWVMNADGSHSTNLTQFTDTRTFALYPAWSPDGHQIAFSKLDSINNPYDAVTIVVMNDDGSGQTRITNDPSESAVRPAWSPTGTRIAFESRKIGGGITAMINNGSRRTPLDTGLSDVEGGPAWQFGAVPEPGFVLSLASAVAMLTGLGSRKKRLTLHREALDPGAIDTTVRPRIQRRASSSWVQFSA